MTWPDPNAPRNVVAAYVEEVERGTKRAKRLRALTKKDCLVLDALSDAAASPSELAQRLGMPWTEILGSLMRLRNVDLVQSAARKRGWVRCDG